MGVIVGGDTDNGLVLTHVLKMMNKLLRIALLAFIANLLTIALFNYVKTLPGESGTTWFLMLLCLPLTWLTSIIIVIIWVYRGRKTLLKRPLLKWAIPLVLFCTPVPLAVIYYNFIEPETYCTETNLVTGSNYTLRHEEWVYYSNNKMAVDKYYRSGVVDAEENSTDNRDSVWIYFDKAGDTTKVETYKNGKLISVRNKIK